MNSLDSRQFTTVIWDLDGTLLDSFGLFCQIMDELMEARSIASVPHAEMAKHYHGRLEDSIAAVTQGSDELHAEILTDFLDAQNSHYELVEHQLYPDALDFAQKMHEAGAQQVIVSNRGHIGRNNASPRSIVVNSSLGKYIDRVVCGDDTVYRKPDARVLDHTDIVYEPGTTLVVGDQFVDAELAANLGASCILVDRTEHGIPHLEDLNIDHVEIVKMLAV